MHSFSQNWSVKSYGYVYLCRAIHAAANSAHFQLDPGESRVICEAVPSPTGQPSLLTWLTFVVSPGPTDHLFHNSVLFRKYNILVAEPELENQLPIIIRSLESLVTLTNTQYNLYMVDFVFPLYTVRSRDASCQFPVVSGPNDFVCCTSELR